LLEKNARRKFMKYVIKNVNSFELKDIFECGQCFRWNANEDGSYTGVIKNCVIRVQKNGEDVLFNSNSNNLEEIVTQYFDLNRNYSKLKQILSLSLPIK